MRGVKMADTWLWRPLRERESEALRKSLDPEAVPENGSREETKRAGERFSSDRHETAQRSESSNEGPDPSHLPARGVPTGIPLALFT